MTLEAEDTTLVFTSVTYTSCCSQTRFSFAPGKWILLRFPSVNISLSPWHNFHTFCAVIWAQTEISALSPETDIAVHPTWDWRRSASYLRQTLQPIVDCLELRHPVLVLCIFIPCSVLNFLFAQLILFTRSLFLVISTLVIILKLNCIIGYISSVSGVRVKAWTQVAEETVRLARRFPTWTITPSLGLERTGGGEGGGAMEEKGSEGVEKSSTRRWQYLTLISQTVWRGEGEGFRTTVTSGTSFLRVQNF